jgi:hypothetical protein
MIYLADYIYRHPGLPQLNDKTLAGLVARDKKRHRQDTDYNVGWGEIPYTGHKQGVIESGFFHEACHFDTIGLYHNSSLNTPQTIRTVEEFEAPESAVDIVFGSKHTSKFGQPIDKDFKDDFAWNGIVLALQNPVDRSIRSISSPEFYYRFVKDACEYYGRNLFLKLHPWNNGEVEERFRNIASQYGCLCGKIDHKVIENCEFVLAFNSTYAVDCMLRKVKVAQYAPGYFYQSPSVQYTSYTFPGEVATDLEYGLKLCDFLIWRYCFDQTMPVEDWVKMFRVFEKSNDMFPMPKELSYGARRVLSKTA